MTLQEPDTVCDMATRRVKLGPFGEILRGNLRALRRRLPPDREVLTLRALSENLSNSARPLALNTLSEIENGARRVDVDDLVAIASALEVSPVSLLLPMYFTPDDTVDVPGLGVIDVDSAWAWMRDGELPNVDNGGGWARDNVGAWLSMPRRETSLDRLHQYLALVRALLYPSSTAPDVLDARVRLERAERTALRRVKEIGLLSEQFPFETFRVAYEQMLIDLLEDAGDLRNWDLAPREDDLPDGGDRGND